MHLYDSFRPIIRVGSYDGQVANGILATSSFTMFVDPCIGYCSVYKCTTEVEILRIWNNQYMALVYKLKTIIAGKATWKPQKLAPCPAERVNKKQTNTASWEKDDVVAAIHATIKVLNVTGLVVPIIYSFN